MKYKIITLFLITVFGSIVFNIMISNTTHAVVDCNKPFITMPPWYRGLTEDPPECEINLNKAGSDDNLGGSIGPAIYLIALNVGEIMMHIAAYVAIAYIFVGGYRFMISSSNADANAKGRKTIINALIGLVISILSIGIINVLYNAATTGKVV